MITKGLIITIDYDGTIVHDDYPRPGTLKLNAKEVINRLHEEGHHIIIWTCRIYKPLEDAIKLLEDNGIFYRQVNEHHPKMIIKYGNDTRKVFADIYVDDKQLGGIPDDWEEIYKMIQHHIKHLIKQAI